MTDSQATDKEGQQLEIETALREICHRLGAADGDSMIDVLFAAEKDARRYRWLRAGVGVFPHLGMVVVGEALDRACDRGRSPKHSSDSVISAPAKAENLTTVSTTQSVSSSGTAAAPNIHPEDRDYIVTKLEQRVLAKHGGKADPMTHHWNLSEGDSAMHFEAAACIKELVRQLSERSATRTITAQQIHEVYQEEFYRKGKDGKSLAYPTHAELIKAVILRLLGVEITEPWGGADKEGS